MGRPGCQRCPRRRPPDKAGAQRVGQCVGVSGDLRTIAPGRKVDLVLLRADSTFLRPLNDALAALVYAETGADVDTLLVDGRVIVRGGRVVTVDEKRLWARAQEAADRARERNAEAWALAKALEPYIARACRAAAGTPNPVNRWAAALSTRTR